MGKLVIVLLLAILVVLAALFMLAKSKKEQLGRLYVIVSSVAAAFGILVFVFGITAGCLVCMKRCAGKGESCNKDQNCPMMRHGGMHRGRGECNMEMMGNCQGNGGSCSMMGGEQGSCSMKGMGSCSMNEMKCNKCDKIVKEITMEIDSKDLKETPEVKVEVDKKSK